MRRLDGQPPFAAPLVVHFGYHKCLTVLYDSIMRPLADEFGFLYRPEGSYVEGFHGWATNRDAGPRVVTSSGRSDIDWSTLPPYVGSHFVRDPRDLVVSGYHYHLWTEEAWCRARPFYWDWVRERPHADRLDGVLSRDLGAKSYQEVLNELDRDRGMFLEYLVVSHSVEQMSAWNYDDPAVLELRFEDIVGHEVESFDRLLRHYGADDRIRRRGIELAESQAARRPSVDDEPRERRHVRSGRTEQWRTELPAAVIEVFLTDHADLLERLRYPVR